MTKNSIKSTGQKIMNIKLWNMLTNQFELYRWWESGIKWTAQWLQNSNKVMFLDFFFVKEKI